MYRFFEANGQPDIQDIFIMHALGCDTTGLKFSQVEGKKGLIINYYAKKGILTTENGWDEIKKIKECEFVLPMCKIGTECHDDKAILTKLGMIHIYDTNPQKIVNVMEKVNRLFVAEDEYGNDMVYDRIKKGVAEEAFLK